MTALAADAPFLLASIVPDSNEPGGAPAFIAEEQQFVGSILVMDTTSGVYTKAPNAFNAGIGIIAGLAKYNRDNTVGSGDVTDAQVPLPGTYTLPQDGTITGPKFYLSQGYAKDDNTISATSNGGAYPGGSNCLIIRIPEITDPSNPTQKILDLTRVVVRLGAP